MVILRINKEPRLIIKVAQNKNYFQMAVKDETSGVKFISVKFTPDDRLEDFVKNKETDDLVDLILMHRDENNKIVKKKNLKVNFLLRLKGFEFARLQV